MSTGWLVYRCESHGATTYVNANPRPGAMAAQLCCGAAEMVDVLAEREFCDVLKGVAS